MAQNRHELVETMARYDGLIDKLTKNDETLFYLINDLKRLLTDLHPGKSLEFSTRESTLILSCACCDSVSHTIHECELFRDLTMEGRFRVVTRKFICMRCLLKGHDITECPITEKCAECTGPHHRMLCADTEWTKQAKSLARLYPDSPEQEKAGKMRVRVVSGGIPTLRVKAVATVAPMPAPTPVVVPPPSAVPDRTTDSSNQPLISSRVLALRRSRALRLRYNELMNVSDDEW